MKLEDTISFSLKQTIGMGIMLEQARKTETIPDDYRARAWTTTRREKP